MGRRDPKLDVADPCKHSCDCPRRVPRGWWQCRGCTMGYCFASCERWVEADLGKKLIPECARCGWFEEDHFA